MSLMLSRTSRAAVRMGAPLVLASLLFLLVVNSLMPRQSAHADPIPPPEGAPKLALSIMIVSPTLATTAGATLFYRIELRNTGSFSAFGTLLTDQLPLNTFYNSDAAASSGDPPIVANGTMTWIGDVGFDQTVVISFSVDVAPGYSGMIDNDAVVTQSDLAEPITLTAQTTIIDDPIFVIGKWAMPDVPGPGNPLTYTLVVTNLGQPAGGLPVTVTDQIPTNTTFLRAGADGTPGAGETSVIWNRLVNLDHSETSVFSYTVEIDEVISGTVITNDAYQVESAVTDIAAGQVYTTTVIDPIFELTKEILPDPPGSNRELTYTLTLRNRGSLATGIVVSDMIPVGTTYVRGGTLVGDYVTWHLSQLETGAIANLTFTLFVSDVAGIQIVNTNYDVCSAEGICATGQPLTSTVRGPSFIATAALDPIAKKPGGGGGPVTPTLTVANVGPGNALDAEIVLYFDRISVQDSDVEVIPSGGSVVGGPDCGGNCRSYLWTGDLAVQEVITFTTYDPQSTIGGEEGTIYATTILVSDSLGTYVTEPVSATAQGRVTHLANLIPTASAPPVIGAGQFMTISIGVWNSALSTDEPPPPLLTGTVPVSVTLINVNDGGASYEVADRTVLSWTLPAMGPGDRLHRSFTVQVDPNVISGTELVFDDYRTSWYEVEDSTVLSNTGSAITTTVREVGLIDSFKMVTPELALPGPDNTLTYSLYLVNSSPQPLTNVQVYDYLPWEHSTYQRDAMATSGEIISDIVSIAWTGDVAPFSSERITLSVRVDPYFKGVITNTAVISHASLQAPVVRNAVAYITDQPVLRILKVASPSPVEYGDELFYTIRVDNLGQVATGLVITDVVPAGTTYIPDSASGNGILTNGQIRWQTGVIAVGESRTYHFSVEVNRTDLIVNDDYGVTSSEGVSARGAPVETPVRGGGFVFLPIVLR